MGNLTTNAAWKYLQISSEPANHDAIFMDGHNNFYLAVHNHTKTWISPTLLHNALYHCLYQ